MFTVLRSLLLIACIPFVALALDPSNPTGFCSRFIDEKEIATCKARTERDDVDWYAGTVCNLQKEDQAFWSCWNSIKGKEFDPKSLEACADSRDITDQDRQVCVSNALGNRKPASLQKKMFQSFLGN